MLSAKPQRPSKNYLPFWPPALTLGEIHDSWSLNVSRHLWTCAVSYLNGHVRNPSVIMRKIWWKFFRFSCWILIRSFVWLAEVLGWKLAGRNRLYDSMAVSRDIIFLILRYWSTGPFILQLSTSPPCLRRLEKWLCPWTTGWLTHTVWAEERTTPWRSKSLDTSWRTKLKPWDVTFSPMMDLSISVPTSTSGGHYKREYIISEKMRFTDSTCHEIHLWSYRSSLLFFFLFFCPALSLTHSVESSQNSFCPTIFLPSFLSILVRVCSCVQQRVRGWVWQASVLL